MRMQLYKIEIARWNRVATGFIVAPDKHRASEVVIEHEVAINQENDGFALRRVDDSLPEDQRIGLDALLDTAPVGMASFCSPIGWIAHAIPTPKLNLYRIEIADGDDQFIIAPSRDVAAAVHCEHIDLKDGEGQLFRIHDGLLGLSTEALRGLPTLLEFGPIGLVGWDTKHGWSMK